MAATVGERGVASVFHLERDLVRRQQNQGLFLHEISTVRSSPIQPPAVSPCTSDQRDKVLRSKVELPSFQDSTAK